MNKTSIFLGIILLFVLLAGGVYFFVLRDTSVAPTNNPSFNPDGTPVTIPRDDTNDFVVDTTPEKEKTILTQIHSAPVAGASVKSTEIEITVGSTTETVVEQTVTYVDKQTGHVFLYNSEENTAERISNTTFPGIQSVYWFTNPNNVAFRYIDGDGEIETYLGEISDGSITGSYLSLGIPAIQTFENSILSITTTERGSEGFVANPDGRDEKKVFETNLLNITIPAFSDSFVAVLTKPVSSLSGALYYYENGSQKRILGGRQGLTALPNKTGALVLFAESVNQKFSAGVFDREEGNIRSLPLELLPEKCVWATEETFYCMVPEIIPPANYPESWYQGYISFTDSLWRINTSTGTARAIAFFDEKGPFDGVELSIDENEEYLTFINRRDGSLWGFDL